MKALVIAPQPFFSPRGTPFSVYYRTLISSELGVKIDFLTYGEGQDIDIPGVRIIRIPRFKRLGNVEIGPSPLKMFLDIFIVLRMIGLLMRNRYDLVHAHEEAVFFAYFLKPLFRFRLVYDMHSSLPQQLTNFKFTTSKFLINVFKKLEDACLRSADAVITICPDLYNYVNQIISDRHKHYLIENSIFEKVKIVENANSKMNPPSYAPQDEILPVRQNGKPLIVYAGTLEEYQGIDILIRSFELVVKEDSDARLLIAGGTKEQVEKYSKLASGCGIRDKVVFTGRVSQTVAKHYTALANVLVSPRNDGTNTPLKIYEQLASGIPLVATNIYSHTQVLTEEVAFLVNPEPQSMGSGILAALNSNEEAKKKVANARQLYEDKYSRRVYSNKLKQLLENL